MVINLERYLVYALILSMTTYAIPFIRIDLEEIVVPIGTLFIPVLSLLSITRYLYTRKFNYNNFLIIAVGALLFSIPLSSFFSIDIETRRIAKLALYMALPIIFYGVITDEKSLRISLYSIIVVGIITGIYGFYGYLTGDVGEDPERIWWWTYARYWGIHYLPSTRNSDIYYISIPFIICFTMFYYGGEKLISKIILFASSIMFIGGIILSFSRGAWISIILTMVAFLLISRKRGHFWGMSKATLIFGIFIIVGYALLNYYGMIDYFIGRMLSIFSLDKGNYYLKESISNLERLDILKATIDIIIKNPFGVGPDNLRRFYQGYDLLKNHPENSYLHILAENGIIGFIGYLIFVFYPLIIYYKKIINGNEDWVRVVLLLTSFYLAISYMFTVEVFSFYNWIIHSVLWCDVNAKGIRRDAG